MEFKSILKSLINVSQNRCHYPPFESFVSCMMELVDSSETELKEIVKKSLHNDVCAAALYLEFGPHKRLIDEESIFSNDSKFAPMLFYLVSVAYHFKHKIVVICDDLNLSFIHKGSNIFCIVPENGIKSIFYISITGYSIMNNLSLKDEFTQKSLIDNLGISLNLDATFASLNADEKKIKRTSTKNYKVDSENYSNQSNNLNELTTIQDFMEKNLFLDGDNISQICNEAYSNNFKIDYQLSDIRVQKEADVEFVKTFDIDGFTTIVEPDKLLMCINSGGSLVNFKYLDNFVNKNSLKRAITYAGFEMNDNFSAIRFARLAGTNNFDIIACIGYNKKADERVGEFDFKKMVLLAHKSANKFPCRSKADCPYGIEHESFEISRPGNPSQIQSPIYGWDYNRDSFKCLLRGMIDYMKIEVSKIEGVRLYYWIRSFGTKFKFMTSKIDRIGELLEKATQPLNLKAFTEEGGPKALVDFSIKYIPRCGQENVT